MRELSPCRVCGTLIDTWTCGKCYKKLKAFDDKQKLWKSEGLWTDEYRERLAQTYIDMFPIKVQFT